MSGGTHRVGSTAARLARLPYHRRVCRAEFHFPPPPPVTGEATTGPSVQEWVERAHDMGVEMTVVSAEVDRGTPRFHSCLLPSHPRVDEDRLPAFLQAAHEKGIIVLTYYSFMYNKPLREIHPGSPEFRDFVNWGCRTWLDVLPHVYRTVVDAHPGVIMDLLYYARPTTTWADGHSLAPVGVNALGGHYFIETHRTMRDPGFPAKVGRPMGRPYSPRV